MTLLFIDGFDHYDDTEVADKWTGGAGIIETTPPAGRTLNAVRQPGLELSFPQTNEFYCGFAFRTGANADFTMLEIKENNDLHLIFRRRNDGRLEIRRASVIIATSADPYLSPNTWYYIECGGTIADAGGTAEIRVDGVTAVSFVGDTQTGVNAFTDNLALVGGATDYVDDFYFLDGDGTVNNSWLGDVRVETLFPSGAGASSQWTPSAGSNYENVDENPPDDDTTYNEEDTAAQQDTYEFDDLASVLVTVLGVQVSAYVRKTDALSREIRNVIRSGGTDYYGSAVSVPDTYIFRPEIFEEDPDTAVAWTPAGVNAAEFGIDLVS